MARTLHIVAPGLLGPVPEAVADSAGRSVSTPALAALLARGRRVRGGCDAASLFSALHTGGAAEVAEGPVVANAIGVWQPGGLWYRVAPCHLRPRRDGIALFAGDASAPGETEAAMLAESFNEHFAADGLELHVSRYGWVMHAASEPGGPPRPLAELAGLSLEQGLPEGEAGGGWRRLLNEIQMLLHDHPVNQRREAEGELAANGLWIWGGGGALPPAPRIDGVAADMPFIRGLAVLAGIPPDAERPGLTDCTVVGDTYLAGFSAAEDARLSGDVDAWLRAVDAFEAAWAKPLLSAGGIGAGQRVLLHLGSERALRYTRMSRWRWWRRRQPLSSYLSRR